MAKNENTIEIGFEEQIWNSDSDTEYLNSIPGCAESILEEGNTPIDNCIPADKLGL